MSWAKRLILIPWFSFSWFWFARRFTLPIFMFEIFGFLDPNAPEMEPFGAFYTFDHPLVIFGFVALWTNWLIIFLIIDLFRSKRQWERWDCFVKFWVSPNSSNKTRRAKPLLIIFGLLFNWNTICKLQNKCIMKITN